MTKFPTLPIIRPPENLPTSTVHHQATQRISKHKHTTTASHLSQPTHTQILVIKPTSTNNPEKKQSEISLLTTYCQRFTKKKDFKNTTIYITHIKKEKEKNRKRTGRLDMSSNHRFCPPEDTIRRANGFE